MQEAYESERIHVMLKAFQSFDDGKTGFVATFKVSSMLKSMKLLDFDKDRLARAIEQHDPDKSGLINFDTFVAIASDFFDEDEDEEMMQNELRQAFRLYDKEGVGYITTTTLREILSQLDDKLTANDLDAMVHEVDAQGLGRVDVEGFVALMMN